MINDIRLVLEIVSCLLDNVCTVHFQGDTNPVSAHVHNMRSLIARTLSVIS